MAILKKISEIFLQWELSRLQWEPTVKTTTKMIILFLECRKPNNRGEVKVNWCRRAVCLKRRSGLGLQLAIFSIKSLLSSLKFLFLCNTNRVTFNDLHYRVNRFYPSISYNVSCWILIVGQNSRRIWLFYNLKDLKWDQYYSYCCFCCLWPWLRTAKDWISYLCREKSLVDRSSLTWMILAESFIKSICLRIRTSISSNWLVSRWKKLLLVLLQMY